jgi:hypothetical protein
MTSRTIILLPYTTCFPRCGSMQSASRSVLSGPLLRRSAHIIAKGACSQPRLDDSPRSLRGIIRGAINDLGQRAFCPASSFVRSPAPRACHQQYGKCQNSENVVFHVVIAMSAASNDRRQRSRRQECFLKITSDRRSGLPAERQIVAQRICEQGMTMTKRAAR